MNDLAFGMVVIEIVKGFIDIFSFIELFHDLSQSAHLFGPVIFILLTLYYLLFDLFLNFSNNLPRLYFHFSNQLLLLVPQFFNTFLVSLPHPEHLPLLLLHNLLFNKAVEPVLINRLKTNINLFINLVGGVGVLREK